MEADNPNSRSSSIPDDANPSGRGNAQFSANPDPNRTMPFSEAVSVLRQHSFKNMSPTEFEAACLAARTMHFTTFTTINNADINVLEAARNQLHHSDDFLAYISTLHASLTVVDKVSPLVPQLLSEYRRLVMETPTEWAKAVPVRWVGVSRHATRLAIDSHDVPLALSLIPPLREAVAKSAPAADFLVPLQADFLAVCLEGRCYSLAASWIRQHRRLRVDVNATALTGTDVHLIHHYSAMIFIGVKDFKAALQCCRLALSVPSPSAGSFQEAVVSTFKLFVLLSLLVAGRAPSSLKFSSHPFPRLRKSASEYMELAYAFEKRDARQMQQILESNRELFDVQGTLGLAKQVVAALSRQLIIRLTKLFVTMKIEDVAIRAGLRNTEEAHAIILDMIKSNKISASIDDRKGVVRLMDNDISDEESIARDLSTEYMNDCVNIVQRIDSFRESLESDPNYLLKEFSAPQSKRTPSSGSFGGRNSKSTGTDADLLR